MSWSLQDCLSIAQTVASVGAIVGAFGVVFLQRHFEMKRDAARERDEDVGTIGVVRSLAHELGRVCSICVTSPKGEDGFYADPAQELLELRRLLTGLPLERIARLELFQIVVDLRVIASKARQLVEGTDVDRFTAKHTRNDFSVWAKEARGYAAHLEQLANERV